MTGGGRYVRRTARPLDPVTPGPDDLPDTLDEAYAAIGAALAGVPLGGWKIGGSNHASCAAFGVDTPYYGALRADEVMPAGAAVPGFALAEWKGEVEFALRLDADARGYDEWCIALEMPASPLTNLPQAGVAALVADRCAAGALLLGEVVEGALPPLEGAPMVLHVDGREIDRADVTALTAHPEAILTQSLALMRAHGQTPAAGQWVATGGVTACHALPATGRVEVTFQDRVMFAATLARIPDA